MTRTPDPRRSGQALSAGPGPHRPHRWLPTPFFWFLIPGLALLVAFAAYPLIRTVVYSFTNLRGAGTSRFIGWENYIRLFGDEQFWVSAKVTLIYTVVSVLIELVIAWALSLLMQGPISRLGHVLRVVITLPMALCPVVVGIVWRFLFNPQYGWINALLGTPNTDWTGSPTRALGTLIFVDVWAWTPFIFMMLSAGLLAIPTEVKEASRLDGVGAIRGFIHITLPLMLPTMLVAVLLRTIDAFKAFDVPYTLTSGGPGNATTTVGIFLYRRGFAEFQQGYASSLSVVFTIALIVFALIYLAICRRMERIVA